MKIETKQPSIMQQALGEQWHELPIALKAHYTSDENGELREMGAMDINYPVFMQLPLSILKALGALVNKRERAVKTEVCRTYKDGKEYWQRKFEYSDGKIIRFNSVVQYADGNELIEYINPVLGLCMVVWVEEGHLHYIGKYYIIKLGRFKLKVPNFLALGTSSIVETAVDDTHFEMDFKIKHPFFGQVFSYAGRFIKG